MNCLCAIIDEPATPQSTSGGCQLRPARRLLLIFALACLDPARMAQAADGGLPNFNTAEGDFALNTIATNSASTGARNTAIGYLALYFNTSGYANTASGVQALYANSTGSYNTATGVFALNGNNGSYNTATGFQSGNTGNKSTATGYHALVSNTADNNTATGSEALLRNTTGSQNTATGVQALYANSGGNGNTATGFQALFSNTNAGRNTADGFQALSSNTTGGDNTACGTAALISNATGSNNVALGNNAGQNLTTGSNNIDIGANVVGAAAEANTIRIGKSGVQSKTLIAGIYGKTAANGVGVIVGSNGQLGTVLSSVRYKEAIRPMDETSEAVLKLKPVTFRYKEDLDPDKIPQFGLIAEEVEKVDPDLVVRDENGKITTVRYEAVNAMLLNEFLKEHRKAQEQERKVAFLGAALAKQQKQIAALSATIRKVSNKVELSESSPQAVANTQ